MGGMGVAGSRGDWLEGLAKALRTGFESEAPTLIEIPLGPRPALTVLAFVWLKLNFSASTLSSKSCGLTAFRTLAVS
jgi:hypothetical protein